MPSVAFAFVAIHVAVVGAVHLSQQHAVSYPKYTKQQSGRCLKFIHNPRTGGTSIDSINLQLPQGHRAYDTIMEAYLDLAAGSKLFPNETAGHLFDRAHGSELSDEASATAADHYGKFLPLFNFRFVTWLSRATGLTETCQDLHTPPQYDKRVRVWLEEPGCTSFCVVRDPMSRLKSAYKFRHFGNCSHAGFEQWILETFPMRKPISFCHAYPQAEYVYSSDPQQHGKQWCDRVLRLEHLTQDYNALMEEFQKPVRMTRHILGTDYCHIDTAKLSQEAKSKVYAQYKADYDAFGYSPP
mmetsp:Transcript_141986/g.441482  ORF Transcript_141986/g.441482 Transcript_141986/m.441482 type:complete len:298 (-) Transcript_141986:49-942(-)